MAQIHPSTHPKKAAFLRPWSNARERAIWIGAELKRRGTSFSELARQHGYSPSTFTNTAAGKANAYIEPVLAEAVEMHPATLFAEHYNQAGERITRVIGSKRTARGDSPKVQKRVAA
jgi:lambda repressor-like predicted transcriptional regulator